MAERPFLDRPRGVCPACFTRWRLTPDGRLGPHPDPALRWLDCSGAGYLPAEVVSRG